MTHNEIRDRLLQLAQARLKARFGAFEQFRFTVESLPAGAAIMGRAALMPAAWTVGLTLGLDEAAKQIDAHLLRIIDEWAQREAPARQIPVLEGLQPLAAEPQAAPVASQEQRQADRWQLCIDAGLTMPTDTYSHFPRGIGRVAEGLKITRQALQQDLNAHRERLFGK